MTMKLDQVFDDAENQKGKAGPLGMHGGKGFEERLVRLENGVSILDPVSF